MSDSEILEMLDDRFRSICLSHAVDLADAVESGEVEGYPEALDWITCSIDGSAEVIYYGDSLLAIAGADPRDVCDAICDVDRRTGCGQALGILAYQVIEARVLALCEGLLCALAERDEEEIDKASATLRQQRLAAAKKMTSRWGFRDE